MKPPDAYTVGDTVNYEKALNEGPVTKFGRREAGEDGPEPYAGGIVFFSEDEARAWLKLHPELEWSVYGLILPNGWCEDVGSIVCGEDFRRLINDAQVVRINVN